MKPKNPPIGGFFVGRMLANNSNSDNIVIILIIVGVTYGSCGESRCSGTDLGRC